MPVVDQTSEWLKILISTLAGLFAGLLAEPVKSNLGRRIEVLRMERAILLDCHNIAETLEVTESDPQLSEAIFEVPIMSGFDYYWNSKRELFFVSLDSQELLLVCQQIVSTYENAKAGRLNRKPSIEHIRQLVAELLEMATPEKGIGSKIRRFILRRIF